jgi:DHA1 family bicyclomycin/chloramphenicol resistance-like MFS transporter
LNSTAYKDNTLRSDVGSNFLPYFIAISTAIVLAAGNIFMPSLPAMIDYFGGNDKAVLSSASLFYIGFAVSGIVYGYLSDRFGRRLVMMGGMLIFVLGVAICLLANCLWMYQMGNLLEGIGGAAPLVIGFVSIQELFDAEESAKIISRMGVIVGLAPSLSTILGGYLAPFGWRSSYIFLMIIGLLLLTFLFYFYPESHRANRKTNLSPIDFVSSILKVLTTTKFLQYALIYPTLAVGSITFLTIMPIYMLNKLQFSSQYCGYLMGIMMFGLSFGALIGAPLISKFGLLKTIKIGLSLSFISGLIIVISFVFNTPFYITVVGSFLFQASMAITHPPTTTIAIRCFSELKGIASAIRSTFSMLGSAVGAAIGAELYNQNLALVSMAILMSSILVFSLHMKANLNSTKGA